MNARQIVEPLVDALFAVAFCVDELHKNESSPESLEPIQKGFLGAASRLWEQHANFIRATTDESFNEIQELHHGKPVLLGGKTYRSYVEALSMLCHDIELHLRMNARYLSFTNEPLTQEVEPERLLYFIVNQEKRGSPPGMLDGVAARIRSLDRDELSVNAEGELIKWQASKPPVTAPAATADVLSMISVIDTPSAGILAIAKSEDSAESKMRKIVGIDRRFLGKDSKEWGTLLGVDAAAIRKTYFWKEIQRDRKSE